MKAELSNKVRARFVVAAAAGLIGLVAPAASAVTATPGTPEQADACVAALSNAAEAAFNASWEVHVDDRWIADTEAAQAAGHDASSVPFADRIQTRVAEADAAIAQARSAMKAGDIAAADRALLSAGTAYRWAEYNIRHSSAS